MMTQWVITIIILGIAMGYAVYRLYRYFRKSGKKPADCDGCSSDCSSCSLNVSIREPGRKTLSGSKK